MVCAFCAKHLFPATLFLFETLLINSEALTMLNKSSQALACITLLTLVFSLADARLALAEPKGDESIFKYKKELAITDQQEAELRSIISKIQDILKEKTEELNKHRAELNKMLEDKADLAKIKEKLHAIAMIQADATYEDIAGIRAIEIELTADQMSKWRGMQEKFRKSQEKTQAISPEQKGSVQ